MNISNELLNNLISYLSKKPYVESFQLINQINKEMQNEIKIPEKKVTESKEIKK